MCRCFGCRSFVMESANEYDGEGALLYEVVHGAMAYDVTPTSHPVVNEGSQAMVEGFISIFDTITYRKGASIIRMMEGFLSRKTLFAGLSRLLERLKFQSAEQDDIFEDLNQVAHEDKKILPGIHLTDIMHTFTLQTGLPLIRVQAVSTNTIYLSQEKFEVPPVIRNHRQRSSSSWQENPYDVFGLLYHNRKMNSMYALNKDQTNPATKTHKRNMTLWEIPVTMATADEPNFGNHIPRFWLSRRIVVKSHGHDISKWIIVNPEGVNYYRVLYDQKLTGLIQTQLKTDHFVISSMAKSQLINDYFNMAEAGYVPYTSAFCMTSFLGKKPEVKNHHVFWFAALGALKNLMPLISSEETAFERFKRYLLPKHESALHQTGWTPPSTSQEHGVNVLIRTSLMDWACALEAKRCYKIAHKYFATWIKNPDSNPIPLDHWMRAEAANKFF